MAPAPQDLRAVLAQLPLWQGEPSGKAITRTFKFKDFKVAFAFMTQVAAKADAMNHHPEWFNVYARVDVRLTTHDADALTALDLELAQFMDASALALSSPS